MPPDSSPPMRMSRSSMRSQMYLKPMPHSCSLRPYFAAMRSSMRVVLKARTTSPGHCLRFSSHSRITREALVRIHEAAVFGHCAQAVGIAVGGQSGLAVLAHHCFLQHRDVRRDRLGVDAGKQRVHLAANFEVIDAVLGEDALQHAASRAIHHVDGELEAGLLDGIEIDERS